VRLEASDLERRRECRADQAVVERVISAEEEEAASPGPI
jgi:hypothetical protein